MARSRIRLRREGVWGFGAHPDETIALVPFVVHCEANGPVLVQGRYVHFDLEAVAVRRKAMTNTQRDQVLEEHGIEEDFRGARFDETLVSRGIASRSPVC